MTRTIKAGEFKAKCLKLLDDVAATGDTLVITKRGKPVAELRPVAAKPKPLVGFMKGQVKILGDIISPLDDVEWDVLKDE
ncbi:MAG TPA: type II toxin-antitoxin system prevent-host-death family antitoxin [Alphaproteobacteria bacterium]